MRPSRRLSFSALVVAGGLLLGAASGAVYVAHSAPDASKPAPFASVVPQPRAAHHAPADLPAQILYSTPPPGLTPLPVTTTATPTVTPTATPTASPTASATPSATPTVRPTGSATPTPVPTGSATPHPSASATPSATPSH